MGQVSSERFSAKGRILVAEDNSINQLVTRTMVEQLGYIVEVAADGAAAVQSHLQSPFDLIVMDCQMPQMDGLEATRAIRNHELGSRSKRVPIVALTASAFGSEESACRIAGMDDFLSKPVRREQLGRVLDQWLGGKISVLNPERLRVLRDSEAAAGKPLIQTLVDIFVTNLPKHLAEIEQAILAKNWDALGKECHTLAGSAASLGVDGVRHSAFELENNARVHRDEEIQALFTILKKNCENGKMALLELRKDL